MLRALGAALALLILGLVPAKAHEYWISPERYRIEPGEPILAQLRNGQEFNGVALPYIAAGYARFEIVEGSRVRAVEGRMGDDPALAMPSGGAGLAIVALETAPNQVTYTEWERFEAFVQHKDAAWALDEHRRRGLPETGFRESYTRHVKALIAVGDGEGQDRALGLVTEIVAGANPYTDDLSAGLPLRVLLAGQPRAEAQLELFDKAPDGAVAISYHRTDAEGRVTVPVVPGHEYFADAVLLRATGSGIAAGPVWESLWAGLSFAVPQHR